jgi:hypothetical protein
MNMKAYTSKRMRMIMKTKQGYTIKVVTYVHKDGWYVEIPKLVTTYDKK